MSKRERDSAYYLRLLAKKNPDVYKRWEAGEFPSVRSACRAAKLRHDDAPLTLLKRAWRRATAADRSAFDDWTKATGVKIATAVPTRRDLIGPDGRLTEPAKKRIQARIDHENIRMGVLMKKLGFSHLDPSLGLALARRHKMRREVLEAVAKWLSSPMA